MMLSMPVPDENQAEAVEETTSPSSGGGGAFKGITADAITSAASALKRTDTAAAKPKEDARSEMLKFISNKKVCAVLRFGFGLVTYGLCTCSST